MDNKTKDIGCDCDVLHAETVQKVRSEMITDDELYDLADFFKVFGDNTRTKILCALSSSEMCVCDLASLFNMTKSAISHQLRILRENNLVKYRREGKVVFYSLADEHVVQILIMGTEHINEAKTEE